MVSGAKIPDLITICGDFAPYFCTDVIQLSCSDQPTGRLALVFELMDMNIYELIRGRSHYVAEERIRR